MYDDEYKSTGAAYEWKKIVDEDEIDIILDKIDPNKILWEAPNKDQQVFFILKLGNTVNLGNISSDDITSLETLRKGLRGDTLGKL